MSLVRVSSYCPIAIVGLACRFPGGVESPDQFWNNIRSKDEQVEPIPKELFNGQPLLPDTTNGEYAKVGCFIHDITRFDAAFFGLSPREATDMDPQQRMLLELAWLCMEDAAVTPEQLAELETGVYVGVINHDYERLILSNPSNISAYTGLGRSTSIAANRISYCFNFSGPSITIDTACSSSLTAVDSACKALASSEIDVAFAGGANAILSLESYIEFSQATMLSKSGKCHAFDAKADGFVRAEGAGLILLKRLADALADGDRIHATILATIVNQDGKTSGIMAPSVQAQSKMILECMASCGLSPEQIGYVEAHGTGTQLGDTIEARSIGQTYGNSTTLKKLPIGSVKTNIGHTESAAGIAGLIKTVLSIKHREIPPNLNFVHPNPAIDFENLGIRVPVEVEPWRNSGGEPLIAAVNSFGFGGTNAHAILRQAPKSWNIRSEGHKKPLVLPLTGPTSDAVTELQSTAIKLTDANSACHTLGRRPRSTIRQACVLSGQQIISALRVSDDKNFLQVESPSEQLRFPIAFVFNGIGSNWLSNEGGLYASEPEFRSVIDLCDSLFQSISPSFAIRSFFTKKALSRQPSVELSHAVHFSLQIGLTELWKSWGIQPQAVVGHSVGEIAAAYAAGCIDLCKAVKIVALRARALQKLCGSGLMLAASISPQIAQSYIEDGNDELFIAAINSPSSITFSGTSTAIRLLEIELKKKGVFCRELELPVPFHSPLIDQCSTEVRASIDELSIARMDCRWFSSLNGLEIQNQTKDIDFWWRNFRSPVRFEDALNNCLAESFRVFVEIGPHPYLGLNISECLQKKNLVGHVVGCLKKNENDDQTIRSAAATLFNLGCNINWERINPKSSVCDLPKTKFNRKRFWLHNDIHCASIAPELNLPVINSQPITKTGEPNLHVWDIPLIVRDWPWLNKHRLYGETIFPAAGYIETVLESAKHRFGDKALEINSMEFIKLLQLDQSSKEYSISLCLEVADDQKSELIRFQFQDQPGLSNYCQGKLKRLYLPNPEFRQVQFEEFTSGNESEWMNRVQFNLPGFEGDFATWIIRNAKLLSESEAMLEIEFGDRDATQLNYSIDPSLLDICFRAVSMLINDSKLFLPIEINRLQYWRKPSRKLRCSIFVTQLTEESFSANIDIADVSGKLCARIYELKLQSFTSNRSNQFIENLSPDVYVPKWVRHQHSFALTSGAIRQRLSEFALTRSNAYQRDVYYEYVAQELERITIAYIGQALQELGLETSKPTSISFSSLMRKCDVDYQQEKQFFSCLELLERNQFIVFTNKESVNVEFLHEVPHHPQQVLSKILNLPYLAEYLSELLLITRCGENLAKVLSGQMTGLDSLFPNGSVDDLRNFYSNSPTCRIYNEVLCESIELLLESWVEDRPCRILELGGGTGALLNLLTPILSRYRIEYTFSDISQIFLRHAKTRFRELDFVTYQQFDADSDPFVQGFTHHEFDLILASDTLHLARSLEFTFQQIRWLLQPNGHLHFVELTNEPSWARIVFGMLSGWWHRTHTIERSCSPSRSRDEWENKLAQHGFECLTALGDATEIAGSLHTVFVARRSAEFPLPYSQKAYVERNSIIFCDDSPFSKQFIQNFGSQSVVIVKSGEEFLQSKLSFSIRSNHREDFIRLFRVILRQRMFPQEVIYLWNFSTTSSLNKGLSFFDTGPSPTLTISYILQALDQFSKRINNFAIITSNAQVVSNKIEFSGCLQARLWGVGRTLANEYSDLHCRLIDVDSSDSDSVLALYDFIHSNSEIQELALRNNQIYTPILCPISSFQSEAQATRLRCIRPGDLESLQFQPITRPVPENNEVLIQVATTSLNFRDVMVVLKAIPDNMINQGYMQHSIGIECTGTVVEIGQGVQTLKVGDKVIALAKHSFASHVTVNENFVCPMHAPLGYEASAGVPTAYITALHCFSRITKLQSNPSILIHSASGGVGLALVNLAQSRNLPIFATAGSAEKRRYLRLRGVRYVSDSRSNSYVEDILQWTDQEGVDIVINSLSGELAIANRKVLKLDGLLIELGKSIDRDLVHQSIRSTSTQISIDIVDIDQLWKEDSALTSSYLQQIFTKIHKQELPALPYRVFSSENVVEAFRHMVAAKHIGKVVVSMQQKFKPQLKHEFQIRTDTTYLVAGGTRGFGFATLQWLCEQGARFVVVISRSPKGSDQFQNFVDRTLTSDVQIQHIVCDITNQSELISKLQQINDIFPVVRGVIHCASNIDDHLLATLTEQSDRISSSAKVLGAWNLYHATKQSKLDFFVLYSSVASLLGPAGQASYSAANAFLDSFADYLRDQNVPATSVNWGAVSDFGYVADNPKQSIETIEKFGVLPFPAKKMLDSLHRAPNEKYESRLLVTGHRKQNRNFNGRLRYQQSLTVGAQSNESDQLLPVSKSRNLQQTVLACVARVFEMEEEEIDIGEPLVHYGLDSLMAVELSHFLKSRCDVIIAAAELLEPLSINEIVRHQTDSVN